jgi:hypothetical protein
MTQRTNAQRPRVCSPRGTADPPIPAVRLRFLAEQIHGLGPRPLFELLAEIVSGAPSMERIERYAHLSREHGDFIRANDGDQFSGRFFVIDGTEK